MLLEHCWDFAHESRSNVIDVHVRALREKIDRRFGVAALLLDEPTSALDGPDAALITELARDHVIAGGTVVLASHNLAVVRKRRRLGPGPRRGPPPRRAAHTAHSGDTHAQ